MAVLNSTQLARLRRKLVGGLGDATIDFDKPTVNAAFQAVEDWFESEQANLNTAVNTATSPHVFTVNQKRLIFAAWAFLKAIREIG